MPKRIVVDDDGIRTEGGPGYPWSEIVSVGICVLVLPPADQRLRYLDVGHVSGDFLELNEDLDGWPEAVAAIMARSGRPGPDLDPEPVGGCVEIWPARTVGG
ncbi:hypothetical protein [Micromonospora sp. NPDC005806]|uniref:hypothetical protein n=1 Tax=Micromonospora sp. NPDC005806 TaxID=3364234 RepID=UPI0036B8FEB1